jgi:hypothetical protein
MKLLFITILSFLAIPSRGQTATELWKTIPSKAEYIRIENNLSSSANLVQSIRILFDNGFTFAKKDQELNYLVTEVRPFKNGSIQFTVKCQDASITVSGIFNSGISVELAGVRSENNFEKIEKKGMKGSPYFNAFIEMDRVARLIGERISYY